MNHRPAQLDSFILFMLVFSVGFQQISIGPVKVSDSITILAFLYLLLHGKLFVRAELYAILGLLFSIEIVQTLFSIDIAWSFDELIRIAFCMITLFAVLSFMRVVGDRSLHIIINAGTFYLLFSLGWGALEFVHVVPTSMVLMRQLFRFKGFMLDPNYLTLLSIPIMILYNYLRRALPPLKYALGMSVLLLTAVLAQSRSGAALFTLFFFASYALFNRVRLRTVVTVIVLLSGFLFLLYRIGFLNALIFRLTLSDGLSGDIRFKIWRMGFQAFRENMFGFGPGTYRFAIAPFGGRHDAHNTFMWLLINNGIEFIILLAILFLYYLRYHRQSRYDWICIAYFAGASLVFSMDTFRITWIVIATMAYSHSTEKVPVPSGETRKNSVNGRQG